MLLVSVVYAVLLGVAGVSPGLAVVALRVVDEHDARPIGVPRALLRVALLGLAALPTAGLGLATLAFTAVSDPTGRRRGAHDRLTGAVVVDVRPVPAVEVDVEVRPRPIVNLTAMRLMPVADPVVAPTVAVPTAGPAPAPTAAPSTAPRPRRRRTRPSGSWADPRCRARSRRPGR